MFITIPLNERNEPYWPKNFYTTQELADSIGVSRSTIYRFLKSQSDPTS